MPPVPATIGPYVVERALGQGGMGVVYVCRHPALPRPVAVKQILARGADATLLQRFEREAALMAKLKHPAVVAVHDLGRTADGPYIVMELVEGRGLDRAARADDLDPAQGARVTRDLALAVAALHAAGVIHRDIKPSNVLLRADGSPVLLDFGLARELAAERLTRTGEVLGTVAYMPPEQADGRNAELDERVDVYALGALLYELLAGRPPYEGGGIQVIAKVLGPADPAPPTRADGRAAPAGLAAIVRMAMAKQREDRYPTARALAADLSRFLAGEAPIALPQARPRRRAPLVATACAVATLTGVAAAVTLAARGREAEGTTEVPSATASRSTGAGEEVAPLWVVALDQELEYDLEFAEDGAEQSIRFACRLALRRRADEDLGALRFACEVRRLSCRFGLRDTEGGLEYRSDAHPGDHPLGFLGLAVGRPFECELDAATGEVFVRGFDTIRERMARAPRDGLRQLGMSTDQVDAFVRRVFADPFMTASMDALTHVRAAPRVPWRPSPPAQAADYAVRGAPADQVLPPLTSPRLPADRFVLDGTSRYAAGLLDHGELRQDLVRDEGQVVCVTRWNMKRSRP